jgi:hypothetical protein
MKIALSESFLEDLTELPQGLQKKCRDILSSLKTMEVKSLRDTALPGWRIHKLQSSPFLSFSLDMNFRMLAKTDGDSIYFHRAVKHSLADSPRINQNDSEPTPLTITNAKLQPHEVYNALAALGMAPSTIAVFSNVLSEEDLLDTLVSVDDELANYALAVYETSGLIMPRTKYTFLLPDEELEQKLAGRQSDWHLYLHPSQRYVINLPSDYRIALSGSAGTGKTVCAWFRVQELSKQGKRVGFVAPNQSILEVSITKLTELTAGHTSETYFFVPTSSQGLIQLAAAVDHLVIDEGQELAPTWYQALADFCKSHPIGLTIFYDLNQLGANYASGDNQRFANRIDSFMPALKSIPNLLTNGFFINYRNSKEIASHYYGLLKTALPQPLTTELPVFSGGEVVVHAAGNGSKAIFIIAEAVKKLQREFLDEEIAVLVLNGSVQAVQTGLATFGISTTDSLHGENSIIVAGPQVIRGHERKAVVALIASKANATQKTGRSINTYIALSRARDRLVIIES